MKMMLFSGLRDKAVIDQIHPHISQSLDSWFNIRLSDFGSAHSEHIYRYFGITRC